MPLSNLSLFDPQQPALFEESESRSLVGMKPRALDFFAGAGLATEALKPFFQIEVDPENWTGG